MLWYIHCSLAHQPIPSCCYYCTIIKDIYDPLQLRNNSNTKVCIYRGWHARLRTLYLLCYPLSLNCTGCVLFLKSTVCSCVHNLLCIYAYVHKCLRTYVRMCLCPTTPSLNASLDIQCRCIALDIIPICRTYRVLCTLCCLNFAHHYSRSCPQCGHLRMYVPTYAVWSHILYLIP